MSASDPAHDHVTPYDRFALSDAQAEHLLATGESERELIAYFGEEEYRELARLAREARRAPLRTDAPRVIVVPGIMGSQLGVRRAAPLPDDILWLDPVDICSGRLKTLRLPHDGGSRHAVVALGVVLYSYLRLKLYLRAAGFETEFHTYDWRLGVDELGAALAARLAASEDRRTALIGHSMGGLVARAALAARDLAHVERVVLLGTPNSGSFAPVQALRGTYAVVRKVARLDAHNDAEALARGIFSSFPSLYHMLPDMGQTGSLDLLNPEHWPSAGPTPDALLLAGASKARASLAPPDARFAVIVGVSQETVTSVALHADEFVYTITRGGDGTVPTACAMLPGAQTYFTRTAHSELTRDPAIADAIVEILESGTTRKLMKRWRHRAIAAARISDRELLATHAQKVDWTGLEPEARRIYLQTLNEPPRLRLRVPPELRKRPVQR